jgi:hypothetical protein
MSVEIETVDVSASIRISNRSHAILSTLDNGMIADLGHILV